MDTPDSQTCTSSAQRSMTSLCWTHWSYQVSASWSPRCPLNWYSGCCSHPPQSACMAYSVPPYPIYASVSPQCPAYSPRSTDRHYAQALQYIASADPDLQNYMGCLPSVRSSRHSYTNAYPPDWLPHSSPSSPDRWFFLSLSLHSDTGCCPGWWWLSCSNPCYPLRLQPTSLHSRSVHHSLSCQWNPGNRSWCSSCSDLRQSKTLTYPAPYNCHSCHGPDPSPRYQCSHSSASVL